jgi:hypothetical protein
LIIEEILNKNHHRCPWNFFIFSIKHLHFGIFFLYAWSAGYHLSHNDHSIHPHTQKTPTTFNSLMKKKRVIFFWTSQKTSMRSGKDKSTGRISILEWNNSTMSIEQRAIYRKKYFLYVFLRRLQIDYVIYPSINCIYREQTIVTLFWVSHAILYEIHCC